MHKSVMALAVAGALAAPAAMAQVQIGGGIHLQYFQNDSGRTGFEKTDVLTTSEPELYFRGEEKLGGGLSAWFQCTSSLDVLGVAAQSTTGAGQWCGRNSAIGFRGDFGNFFFGTWDTPHKLVSNLARGWWGGTNTLQGGSLILLANDSDSNIPNQGDSFYRRHSRSINYHSPDWSGFNLQVATSSANEATAITSASGLDKPRLMSIAGQFRTGPFFAGVGYETHDNFGSSPGLTVINGKDTSMNVAVGFTFFGALRLSALYMNAEYDADAPATPTVEHDGFAFYLDWTLSGPHKLYAQYALRNETEVGGAEVADSAVDLWGVAYGYNFSKRTQVYVAFQQMTNDPAAAFAWGTTATQLGGKQKVFGLGMRHSF
jgi:predicted porin